MVPYLWVEADIGGRNLGVKRIGTPWKVREERARCGISKVSGYKKNREKSANKFVQYFTMEKKKQEV